MSDLAQFYSYLREFGGEKFVSQFLQDNTITKNALTNILAAGDNNAPAVVTPSSQTALATYNSMLGGNKVAPGITNDNFANYLNDVKENLGTKNPLEDTSEFDLNLISGAGVISTNEHTKFHWINVTGDDKFKHLFSFFYGITGTLDGTAVTWEVNGTKVAGSELNPANTRIKLLVKSKNNVLSWYRYQNGTAEGVKTNNNTVREILTKVRVEKLVGNQWVVSHIVPNLIIKPNAVNFDLSTLFANLNTRVTSSANRHYLANLNAEYVLGENEEWTNPLVQNKYIQAFVSAIYDKLPVNQTNIGDQGVYKQTEESLATGQDPYLEFTTTPTVKEKAAWKTFMPKYHNNYFKMEGERVITGNYKIGSNGQSFSSLWLDYDNQIVKMAVDKYHGELNVVVTVPTYFQSLPKLPSNVHNNDVYTILRFDNVGEQPKFGSPWIKAINDRNNTTFNNHARYSSQTDNLFEAFELNNSIYYLPTWESAEGIKQKLSQVAFSLSPLSSRTNQLDVNRQLVYNVGKFGFHNDGLWNYAQVLLPMVLTTSHVDLSVYNNLDLSTEYRFDESTRQPLRGSALFGSQVFYFNFKFEADAQGKIYAYPKATETYTYLPSGAFQANAINNFDGYKDAATGKYLRSKMIEASGAGKTSDYFGVTWKVDSPETKGAFAFDVDDGSKTVSAEDFNKFISYNTIVNSTTRFDYFNTDRNTVYVSSKNLSELLEQNYFYNLSFTPSEYNQTRRLKLEPTHMKIMHFNNSGNSLIYLNTLGDGVIYRSMLTVNNPNLISNTTTLTNSTAANSWFNWERYWDVGNGTVYNGFPDATTEIWVDGDHIFADSIFPDDRSTYRNPGYYWKWLPYQNNTNDISATKARFVKSIKFTPIQY
ncbi:hypothetical protein [Mycoplasmopsis columbinasalis]|uniref:Uncharacterized protein n=1 Tax=Mycoplasmopsis columbinasalis TaxID=114880 RepID=A0A449BAZ3_9BACT|nr:hypothetical protein [Mycoplasmopsis columbinasalis]VEU78363.1 Uncharacterised protein [Mycoplasmopsis columbinasalis]